MVKIKQKKCKGTSAVSVKGCGTLSYWRKYGLCKKCYTDWLLNTEDGKEKLNKATIKATKPRRDLEKAIKADKEKKSLSTLKSNTTHLVHRYIRLRDKGKPCISCGQSWSSSFQAGHFYPAGKYSTLKYDEDNIHGQCQSCNLRKYGNFDSYALRLPKKIGDKRYKELRERAAEAKKTAFKWDRDELNKIREYYKAKIKALK